MKLDKKIRSDDTNEKSVDITRLTFLAILSNQNALMKMSNNFDIKFVV